MPLEYALLECSCAESCGRIRRNNWRRSRNHCRHRTALSLIGWESWTVFQRGSGASIQSDVAHAESTDLDDSSWPVAAANRNYPADAAWFRQWVQVLANLHAMT
jgi:hypothetical protein